MSDSDFNYYFYCEKRTLRKNVDLSRIIIVSWSIGFFFTVWSRIKKNYIFPFSAISITMIDIKMDFVLTKKKTLITIWILTYTYKNSWLSVTDYINYFLKYFWINRLILIQWFFFYFMTIIITNEMLRKKKF